MFREPENDPTPEDDAHTAAKVLTLMIWTPIILVMVVIFGACSYALGGSGGLVVAVLFAAAMVWVLWSVATGRIRKK